MIRKYIKTKIFDNMSKEEMLERYQSSKLRDICNMTLFYDCYAYSFKARCKSVLEYIKRYGLRKYLKQLWHNKDRVSRLIYLRFILGPERKRHIIYQSKFIACYNKRLNKYETQYYK